MAEHRRVPDMPPNGQTNTQKSGRFLEESFHCTRKEAQQITGNRGKKSQTVCSHHKWEMTSKDQIGTVMEWKEDEWKMAPVAHMEVLQRAKAAQVFVMYDRIDSGVRAI